MRDAAHTIPDVEVPPLSAELLAAHFENNHDLHGLVLRNGSYTGLILSKAQMDGMDLRQAIFQRAKLAGADMRNVEATRSTFTLADMRGANLKGATLTEAALNHTDLRKADLRGAVLSPGTKLDGAKVSGLKIDRHALRSLGDEHGGMTAAALADLDIHDDQMRLAVSFGGFWSGLHIVAVTIFVLPYAAFLLRRYLESLELLCEGANCVALREALWTYIVTGGSRDGAIDVTAITIFAFLLIYNLMRLSLVFKSRALTLAETAAGIPRRFVLSGYWLFAYHACKWLLLLNLFLIGVHTYRFMDTLVYP